MLFDYRYWLRRFLDWLLNDADDSEKMVTKGLIGESPFLLVYLHTCLITDEKSNSEDNNQWIGALPSPFDILVSDKISAVVTAALFKEGGSVANRVGAGIGLGGHWTHSTRWALERLAARVMGSFPFIEGGHAEQIRVPVKPKSGSSYSRLQLSEC